MLDEVMADVRLRMLLWESVESWASKVDEWYHMNFHELNVEDMNLFTVKNVKNINQLEKGLPKNLVVPQLKEDVETMKDKLPIIAYLRNPSLRQRHWAKIETTLNHKFRPDEDVTLELLEQLNVFSFANELMEVSAQASSEAALELLLKKVRVNFNEISVCTIIFCRWRKLGKHWNLLLCHIVTQKTCLYWVHLRKCKLF